MDLTNDQAVEWLRKHSVLAVFHRDRIVLILPFREMYAEAFREQGFKLEIKRGFTLAYTEPGDDLKDVVGAAMTAWREKLSPIDQISDSLGQPPPIKFDFRTNM